MESRSIYSLSFQSLTPESSGVEEQIQESSHRVNQFPKLCCCCCVYRAVGRVLCQKVWLAKTSFPVGLVSSHAGPSSCSWCTSTQKTAGKHMRKMVMPSVSLSWFLFVSEITVVLSVKCCGYSVPSQTSLFVALTSWRVALPMATECFVYDSSSQVCFKTKAMLGYVELITK